MPTPDWLKELQQRKIEDPSPRTPRMSTHSNNADWIERYLRQDGHRTWGFVIYRCTYTSDTDWAEFMRRLRYSVEHQLEYYNGLDLMNSLAFTVFENQSVFDGASTSTIRDHFKEWAVTASQKEQDTGPADSQRYRYCIHVNDEALDSVVHKAPAPGGSVNRVGFVNLIDKIWEPYEPTREEMDYDDDFEPSEEEPIEGCVLEDVGWMRMRYDRIMISYYHHLRSDLAWENEYHRPPEIKQH